MKRAVLLGDSRGRIRDFPESARREVGHQILRLQLGLDPTDWKPVKSIGPGVREIRIRDAAGAFRVIYVAIYSEAIYVLHAFQKKTNVTDRRDLNLATLRLRLLQRENS